MYRYKRILVGLTLSERDETTVRYTAMVSRMAASEKTFFVHVVPSLEIPKEVRDKYPELAKPTDEAAEDRMADLVRRHWDGDSSTELAFEAVEGSPATEILRLTHRKQIDLVVVGRRADQQDRGLLPERLARKAPCSVLVVPEGSPNVITNLLVAADFSNDSADAMEVALALARAVSLSKIVCLHAYWLPKVLHPANDGESKAFLALLHSCAKMRYEDFIGRFEPDNLSVVPILQREKNPAKAVMNAVEVERADVVVVGARGRAAGAAVLLGSVTERLISWTNVPLLAVKKKGAGLSFVKALLLRV